MRAMRPPIALFAAALFTASPVSAIQLTVIGDSLTKEYQVTFPNITVPLAGIAIAGIDPLNPSARNWAEILDARRNAHFDLGTYKSSILSAWSDLRLIGHEYNWAVPGATARAISLLISNPNSTELTSDPDFAELIAYTNFGIAADWKLSPSRMASQVQTTSEGVVIWCGGNDVRFGNTDPLASFGGSKIRYETIYNGDGTGAGDPLPLMNSIKTSIQTTALFVRGANASIPIAVCAVPHVGCAPEVKALWPTDATRTGRITAALDALNAELKTWTETTFGGVWVDIYTPTKQLIDGTLEIGGVSFINAPDAIASTTPASAHNAYLFSHDGFHPTTTVQATIAQQVQQAFMSKWPALYGTSLPLTDREVVKDVLGLPVSKGFDDYMVASGVPSGQRGTTDDPDGDGLKNIVEFALAGQHPMQRAADAGLQPQTAGSNATLTWMPRFDSNIYAAISCEQSTTLSGWTDVPAGQIMVNPDGTVTATVPQPVSGPLFLRLKVTVTP